MCTKESKMNYKFDGSKVYFTSDTHFYHSNIIGFCKRPFKNVEDMNETLIGNWNRVVSQDDIVFHLGDFCLGGSHEWTKILNRLNGKIYLILGNHDLPKIRNYHSIHD
jgi:calcineurin-like phosphoesterase family protein